MRSRWLVLATTLTATAALVAPGAGVAATGAADPREPGGGLPVTGFAVAGETSVGTVQDNAAALDVLSVAGITVKRTGADVTQPVGDTITLLNEANDLGLRPELLVSNYDNRLGDFRAQTAANLLRSAANRRTVARAIAQILRDHPWSGVNIDLERLRAADAPGLVAFVQEVKRQIFSLRGVVRQVTVDVGASTSLGDYKASGFSLGPLGQVADRLVLMGYDLHGPTWSTSGPIGPLPWVRQTLDVMQTRVESSKIDLGIAGYGYTWPRQTTGTVISTARARQLVDNFGVQSAYHARVAEWSGKLENGTVLWWSDLHSYNARVQLARNEGLHGVAVWRLGLADSLVIP